MKKPLKISMAIIGSMFFYFLGSQSSKETPQEDNEQIVVERQSVYDEPLPIAEEYYSLIPAALPAPSVENQNEPLQALSTQEVPPDSKLHLPFLKVISIHDGDSIKLLTLEKKQLTIRLEGIDAPELGQEYGRKSKDGLGAILKEQGGNVYMDKTGVDKYGRTLAKLYLPDERDVNEVMISRGLAWHFKKYNNEKHLDQAEKEARASKAGLWGMDIAPMSPWDFRAKQKELAFIKKQRAQEELQAQQLAKEREASYPKKVEVDSKKYWINGNSSKRHNRGCRWYGNTKRGYYSSERKGSACGICGG